MREAGSGLHDGVGALVVWTSGTDSFVVTTGPVGEVVDVERVGDGPGTCPLVGMVVAGGGTVVAVGFEPPDRLAGWVVAVGGVVVGGGGTVVVTTGMGGTGNGRAGGGIGWVVVVGAGIVGGVVGVGAAPDRPDRVNELGPVTAPPVGWLAVRSRAVAVNPVDERTMAPTITATRAKRGLETLPRRVFC